MKSWKNGKPPYTRDYTPQNGKTYWYYRRGDFQRSLPGRADPNFMDAWAAAHLAYSEEQTPTRLKPDGTLRWYAEEYFSSPEFKKNLELSTQKQKMSTWREILADYGHWEFKRIQRRHVKIIRNAKADIPNRANERVVQLCCLFNWAIEDEYVKYNPAAKMRKLSVVTEGFQTWSRAEIARYRSYWQVGSVERLMFELYLGTAQRGGDVVGMGWHQYDDGYLIVKPKKTRKSKKAPTLSLKVSADLAACLALVPRDQEFFVLSRFGERYSTQAFQKRLVRAASAAALPPKLSGHGLRKAKITALAEAGSSTLELMAWSGHLTPSQLSPYVEQANSKTLADNAIAKEEAHLALAGGVISTPRAI